MIVGLPDSLRPNQVFGNLLWSHTGPTFENQRGPEDRSVLSIQEVLSFEQVSYRLLGLLDTHNPLKGIRGVIRTVGSEILPIGTISIKIYRLHMYNN